MSLDVYLVVTKPTEVYESNITHNLNLMAREVSEDFYKTLWRPEELNLTTAEQLIPMLTAGLNTLLSDPERFKKFNPSNGWGSYERLVEFVDHYLHACKETPNAEVRASR